MRDSRSRRLMWIAGTALLLVLLAGLAVRHEAEEGAALLHAGKRAARFRREDRRCRAHPHRLEKRELRYRQIRQGLGPARPWRLSASLELVRSTLIGLAALETIEPKTARADWLQYIDLDMPPAGNGTLITVSDGGGHVIASLITGKAEEIGDTSGSQGLFVRDAGEDQSFLARSVFTPRPIPASGSTRMWSRSMSRASPRSMSIPHRVRLLWCAARRQPDINFSLDAMPKGRSLSSVGAGEPHRRTRSSISASTSPMSRPRRISTFPNRRASSPRPMTGLS